MRYCSHHEVYRSDAWWSVYLRADRCVVYMVHAESKMKTNPSTDVDLIQGEKENTPKTKIIIRRRKMMDLFFPPDPRMLFGCARKENRKNVCLFFVFGVLLFFYGGSRQISGCARNCVIRKQRRRKKAKKEV